MLLVPDADGDYDLAAARAQVQPGANYGLLLGTVTLQLRANKTPTKVLGFRAWGATRRG